MGRKRTYKRLHPQLRNAFVEEHWNLKNPAAGVYTFDLLTPAGCSMLLDETAAFEKWKGKRVAPNSMNKYGMTLDEIGLDAWLDRLMSKWVATLTRTWFPEIGPLKEHYGFIVDYAADKQRSLAEHFDSSDVTLNVCLGRKWTGGKLVFRGPRGGKIEIAHRPGRAIIHRGKHLHKALPVTSGSRSNLILWCST